MVPHTTCHQSAFMKMVTTLNLISGHWVASCMRYVNVSINKVLNLNLVSGYFSASRHFTFNVVICIYFKYACFFICFICIKKNIYAFHLGFFLILILFLFSRFKLSLFAHLIIRNLLPLQQLSLIFILSIDGSAAVSILWWQDESLFFM